MKKSFIFSFAFMITVSLLAQVPQKMSYQCVVRNSSGVLITNQSVGIKISILLGTTSGTVVYSETYSPNPQTNTNGLVTVEIGSGVPITGSFSDINWASGPYFLKTETDPAGGTSYAIVGTSQLLSVPYALYARTAENGSLWSRNAPNIYFNTGRIGIGTSDPSTYIHGHGSPVASRGQLSLSSPIGQDIFLSLYEANNFKSYLWYNVAEQDLRLQNVTAGDLNLNPYGGNVGVGTNNPGAKFEVMGSATIDGTLNMQNQNISDLADPKNLQDAATMAYVYKLKETIYNELLLAGLNGVVFDRDGNAYKTIRIGTQVWMAENLKTTKLRDGATIPLVTNNNAWNALTNPGRCYFDNDSLTYKNTYGALYNGFTITSGNLCPTGWHVPSNSEWFTLGFYLGGDNDAGGKLKETGLAHWVSPNTLATNETGFTALPGGIRSSLGTFNSLGQYGYWWSSTLSYGTIAYRYIAWNTGNLYGNSTIEKYGFSVRCLRDY
jgi:uncharacterized protein (TIGR02145 family)